MCGVIRELIYSWICLIDGEKSDRTWTGFVSYKIGRKIINNPNDLQKSQRSAAIPVISTNPKDLQKSQKSAAIPSQRSLAIPPQ